MSKKNIEIWVIKLYHISGKINIADLGTKILKDRSILERNDYWTIPFFEKDEWPVKELEMKKKDYTIIMNPKMVMMKTQVKNEILQDEVKDLRKLCLKHNIT